MMKRYKIYFEKRYIKSLIKLDFQTRLQITSWIEKNLKDCTDPRRFGKSLKGKLKKYWRYRIGDYRLLVEIKDEELIVLAIDIGHRKDAYK